MMGAPRVWSDRFPLVLGSRGLPTNRPGCRRGVGPAVGGSRRVSDSPNRATRRPSLRVGFHTRIGIASGIERLRVSGDGSSTRSIGSWTCSLTIQPGGLCLMGSQSARGLPRGSSRASCRAGELVFERPRWGRTVVCAARLAAPERRNARAEPVGGSARRVGVRFGVAWRQLRRRPDRAGRDQPVIGHRQASTTPKRDPDPSHRVRIRDPDRGSARTDTRVRSRKRHAR